ncbi:MAG: lipopolysaccharide biosynthesis protein, partial [Gammaproteobacteria bacterium]
KEHFHVVFTLQLAICSLIYLIFFALAPWFAEWFDNEIYATLLRVSALTFLIRPFRNTAQAKLTRDMRFKALAIINVIGLIGTSTISVMLALMDYGPWSLVLGGLSGSIIRTSILMVVSKNYPQLYYNKTIAHSLGTIGIKFSINDIISYLRSQIPNFLIGKFIGPNIVGLFNKGDSLSKLPLKTIGGSAYQTVFRALSSTQDNLDQSRYIYFKTITLVTFYTFPFYIGLLWLAEPFVVNVYGEKWQMAAIPLQILSIAGMLNCITNPSGAVMAAQNLLKIEIKLQLVALAITTAGCIPGIQQENLALIAIGLLPSGIFLCLTQSFFSLRVLNANFTDLFNALKPAIKLNICLACFIAIYDSLIKTFFPSMNSMTHLILLSCSGGCFYAGIFLFYPVKQLEKEALRWKKLLRITSH